MRSTGAHVKMGPRPLYMLKYLSTGSPLIVDPQVGARRRGPPRINICCAGDCPGHAASTIRPPNRKPDTADRPESESLNAADVGTRGPCRLHQSTLKHSLYYLGQSSYARERLQPLE